MMKQLSLLVLCALLTSINLFSQGNVCEDPIVITSLPFETTDNTLGYEDDYESFEIPWCEARSNVDFFGNEVVYSYTPSADQTVKIEVESANARVRSYILLGCPFHTCVATDEETGFNTTGINSLDLVGGVTYYIALTSIYNTSTPYTFSMVDVCTSPVINYSAESIDCSVPSEISFDFEVLDMGEWPSIIITNSVGGTNPETITSPGTYSITGLPRAFNNLYIYVTHGEYECPFETYGPIAIGCTPLNDNDTFVWDITPDINTGSNEYANTTFATDGPNPFTQTGCNTFDSWCTANPCYRDVWYAVRPEIESCIGYLELSTLGSEFDTKIAIYDESGSVISGNDDFHGVDNGFTSLTTAKVDDGEFYYIQIGGYSNFEYGKIMLEMKLLEIVDTAPAHAPTVVANMEFTGADGWTHYINIETSALILSVDKKGQDIGYLPMDQESLSAVIYSFVGAFDVGLEGRCDEPAWYATAEYHLQMNRNYFFQPEIDPVIPIDVRFYYSEESFNSLDNYYNFYYGGNLQTHTELTHYNIQNTPRWYFLRNCHEEDDPGTMIYSEPSYVYGNCDNYHYGEYTLSEYSVVGGVGLIVETVLPLDLISFTGKNLGSTNLLNWTTANEENMELFVVEKSQDGQNDWRVVGTTPSRGNSTALQQYSLEDSTPYARTYYRLKSIEFSGKNYFSDIIIIDNETFPKEMIRVSPNPVENELNIFSDQVVGQAYQIQIRNMQGVLMYEKMEVGANQTVYNSVDVSDWVAGVYMIHVVSDNQKNVTVKFVKQE